MVKQVIVVRRDLGMRKGKMIAQGAHASLGSILEMFQVTDSTEDFDRDKKQGTYTLSLEVPAGSALDEWFSGHFTKICVYVNSEEELLEVHRNALAKGVPSTLIQDAGKTEFHGVPTYTTLAVGPDFSERVDEVTGNLPLF
jgi:peptidyl-tRNA hydrolase, PTH2 family